MKEQGRQTQEWMIDFYYYFHFPWVLLTLTSFQFSTEMWKTSSVLCFFSQECSETLQQSAWVLCQHSIMSGAKVRSNLIRPLITTQRSLLPPAPSLTPCRLWSGPFNCKPVLGCGQSLQCGRPVPEAAHWICVSVYQDFRQIRPVQPFPLQQGSAPIFWPCAPWIHAWAALLSLQRYGMLWEKTPDHCAWLFIRNARKTQLPDADEELQSRLHLQVSTCESNIV